MGFFEGATDIDLPTEIGPTEETVEALMDYLVGPLLPLKHTDITKKSLSEEQQKSVAKQVHAAAVLYNYYHLNQHRDLEFLKFDQFCHLAIMFKPTILHYLKYMSPSDRPTLTDPATQLSLTEKAIMEACNTSETLLDASANVSSMIKEWPITKVAVLLIDSKKENCFLKFNDGVWSVIEEDLYPEESTNGIETKKSKKRKLSLMKKYDEGEVGLQQLVFSAVKEEAGIDSGELKVLESHVVYSLSRAKTATRFYIVQSTKLIDENNLVPIQDAIHSLQGPVVTKSAGSWVITPVVEYYYLLPYADIISKFFSRGSNGLPRQVIEGSAVPNIILGSLKSCNNVEIKSKLNLVDANISNSSNEEQGDSKVAKKTHESIGQDTTTISTATLEPVNNVVDDVNSSESIESPFEQKVKETENSGHMITGVNNVNMEQEDMIGSSCVESSKQTHESIKEDTTTTITAAAEPVGMVTDDVITSGSIESPFGQDVKEAENSTSNRITGVNNVYMEQERMLGSSGVESIKKTHESVKEDTTTTITTGEPVDMVIDDVITSGSIESPFGQDIKEREISTSNRITGVNNVDMEQERMLGSSGVESITKTHESVKEDTTTTITTAAEPVDMVIDDVITSGSIESPFGQDVKETEISTSNRITGVNNVDMEQERMLGSSGVESITKIHESVKEDTTTTITAAAEPVGMVTDDVIASGSIESPFGQDVKETENSNSNRITGVNNVDMVQEGMLGSSGVEPIKKTHESIKQNKTTTTATEPVGKVTDDVITSGSIESPFGQDVKEAENSTGNRFTGVNDVDIEQEGMLGSSGVESIKQNKTTNTATTTAAEPVGKVADGVITSGSIESPFDQEVKETENSTGNRITGVNIVNAKQKDINGSRRAESSNSSSGANNKDIDKSPISLRKENQNTKPQTPLKVYHHEKRTASSKKEQKSKDDKIDGEKEPCIMSPHEDNQLITVNHALVPFQQENDGSLEDIQLTVDAAKRSKLSEAALRALKNKRQKLCNQQHRIETELALCDKKIQAIMNGGIGDCLELKLEAVIDCCNEICQQNDTQAKDGTNVHDGSNSPLSLPSLGKTLSETQLTLRKASQELDDICLSNNWMLPTYSTTRSDGGVVANVSIKGTNFECSGLSAVLPSIQEARNSAATHVITKLQQMANEHNTAQL